MDSLTAWANSGCSTTNSNSSCTKHRALERTILLTVKYAIAQLAADNGNKMETLVNAKRSLSQHSKGTDGWKHYTSSSHLIRSHLLGLGPQLLTSVPIPSLFATHKVCSRDINKWSSKLATIFIQEGAWGMKDWKQKNAGIINFRIKDSSVLLRALEIPACPVHWKIWLLQQGVGNISWYFMFMVFSKKKK